MANFDKPPGEVPDDSKKEVVSTDGPKNPQEWGPGTVLDTPAIFDVVSKMTNLDSKVTDVPNDPEGPKGPEKARSQEWGPGTLLDSSFQSAMGNVNWDSARDIKKKSE